MPTYQYRCADCGAELEAVQAFTDDALTVCPQCDGNLRKVFSAVGVVFKGSGFYATDNRTRGKNETAKGSGAEGGSGGSESSASSGSAKDKASSPSGTGQATASGSGSSGSGSSGSGSGSGSGSR